MVLDVEVLNSKLEEASLKKKHGKAFKIECTLFDKPEYKLNSWKFNEWDYGKSKILLPCNARGLFISNNDDQPKIIARGYDKFFNINELNSTTWSSIESNTQGPYEITVKENGCIILISGLEDGTIVVCSKHSTGPRDDVNRNHALAGEVFLRNQLRVMNVDISALAKKLHEMNCTAIAEYCDDSFEEHILEYSKDKAGLYLHGLNRNTPSFETLPISSVSEFALQWGFKSVDYVEMDSVSSLQDFLNKCDKQGHYNEQEIEGFVIRCKDHNGQTFFFKYKFKEPYLMYRQWREATRNYIMTKHRTYRFKAHNFITNKYLDFIVPILDANSQFSQEFLEGKHIIELRKSFLKDYGMSALEILNSEKIKQLEMENEINYKDINADTKFLLIPIATIGCGKTTVSLTLNNMFPETWGHIQNDNITGKDKSKYIKDSLQLFKDGKKFVIADKNNHQFRERGQVFEWFAKFKEDYMPYNCNVQIIALCYTSEITNDLRNLTLERVFSRGDNHQSIKCTTDGDKKVQSIMDGFMNRFQPFDSGKQPDCLFDFNIELNVDSKDSSLTNAKIVLQQLRNHYGDVIPDLPDEVTVQKAFQEALGYKPSITKVIKTKKSQNRRSPVYFSANLSDTAGFSELVNKLIETHSQCAPLVQRIRVAGVKSEFHITLAHRSQLKGNTLLNKQMWAKYMKRYEKQLADTTDVEQKLVATDDFVNYRIKELIWDNHIALVTVELSDTSFIDKDGKVVHDLRCLNKVPHITYALLSGEKTAAYAGKLAEKLSDFGANEDTFNVSFDSRQILKARICINL